MTHAMESETTDVETIVGSAESPGRRLLRGATWSLIGTVGARIFSLLGWIFCARILGKDAFGALGLIQNNARGFMPFSGRGFGATATRYIAEYRETDPQRAGRILSLTMLIGLSAGTMTCVACFFLSDIIADRMLGRPELINEIRLSALLLLTISTHALFVDMLAGFEGFRWIASASIIESITWLVAVGVAVWMFALFGALAALIFSSFTACLWSFRCLLLQCRKFGVPIRLHFKKSDLQVLWIYSLPDILTNLLLAPTYWFASVIVLGSLSNGLAEAAFVTVAQQWRNLLLYIPQALNQVALPIFSQLRSTESMEKVEQSVLLQMSILWLALIGASVAMICCTPLLLKVYGFEGSASIFVVSAVLAIVQSHANLLITFLASSSRMWFLFRLTLVSIVPFAVFSLTLIPRFGAVGLLLSLSFFHATQLILMLSSIRSWQFTTAFVAPLGIFLAFALAAYTSVSTHPYLGYALALPLALAATLVHIWVMPPFVRATLWRVAVSRIPTRRVRAATSLD